MRIANLHIGVDHPVFVIAEIGVNHDGSLDRARELIGLAQAGGADAVKLQLFRADALMHSSSAFATYQKAAPGAAANVTPQETLRRYELSNDDAARLARDIRDAGMIPLATPFSIGDVGMIESIGLDAIKIASPDLVNLPLLRRAARAKRPMLVSTGAATVEEVRSAAKWLHHLSVPFALLHCVSSYPARPQDANLCWIGELGEQGVPVGYSDHTTSLISGALATAAGATIIEKHITYDRDAQGPDHAASADPDDFRQYVRWIREAWRMRGRSGKRVLECEQDVRIVSRQSLVARVDLPAGHRIQESDLIVQRPGTGILAGEIANVVGRIVGAEMSAGTMLNWSMIQPDASTERNDERFHDAA